MLSGKEALISLVEAVGCVGSFCRKLSAFLRRINDDYFL